MTSPQIVFLVLTLLTWVTLVGCLWFAIVKDSFGLSLAAIVVFVVFGTELVGWWNLATVGIPSLQ